MLQISHLTHSIRSISVLKEVLSQRGISFKHLLKISELDPSHIENPEQRINLVNELAFYRNLLRMSDDPELGLALGNAYSLARYGIWGYTLMSAPTARIATEAALKHVLLAYSYFNHELKEEGNTIWLESRPLEDFKDCQQLLADREMAAVVLIFEELTGKRDIIKSLVFPDTFEGNLDQYQSFYNRPVIIEGSSYKTIFNENFFDSPLPKSDLETFKLCCRRCEELSEKLVQPETMADKVREIILSQPLKQVDLDMVSDTLNISSRTLRRRLNDEHTNFKEVYQHCRFELAKNYLLNTDVKVEEIAQLLGYNDPGNFTNAFKRWSGISPTKYRDEMLNISTPQLNYAT